jgi:hypothetical protein
MARSVHAIGPYDALNVNAHTDAVVTVTSNAAPSMSASFAVPMNGMDKQALKITTGSLPQGERGRHYSEVFTATGGTKPYSWSISAGPPPPGIAMDGNGDFAGVPTRAGTFKFAVTVRDANGLATTGNFSLTVNRRPPKITTGSLPQAEQGDSYSEVFTATDGTKPYSWSISAGTPPPGIAMNANGDLAGVPTKPGTFKFAVTVTDAANLTATGNFRLIVMSRSVCGPENGYDCFVQDTAVHNYEVPGPDWGPNSCDWTSPDTVSNCGNLTGANIIRTPSTFGNAMIRCTDATTVPGHPEYIWTTYDAPSTNAWSIDDDAVLLKVTGSGRQYLMRFDPNALTCTMLTSGVVPVTFNGGAIWSHTANNKLYSYSGTNQTQLQQNIVNMGTGAVATTLLFDFNSAACLQNSINGYGGSFPEGNYWIGTVSVSLDDTTFSMAFSSHAAQETAVYLATWTLGQSGCDLWNTATSVITHNGVLLGTVSDAPWGGANGGRFDKFSMHAAIQTPNPDWVSTTPAPNDMVYGSYNEDYYFWQKGTTNVQVCGIGAPNWKAGAAYSDGDRVNPPTTGNVGDYIYQIVNGIGGTTGATAPTTWNQTPGSDTTDNGLTWHNVGLGAASQYFCQGHGWVGYLGQAVGKSGVYHSFSNPSSPQTRLLTIASAGDQHFSNTNANITDSAWIFVMSSDVGTGVHLLDSGTPYPSALYNEGYFLSPPNNPDGSVNSTRTLRRAFHTYNSGWHQVFDVQSAMCVLSQTGKFAVCSTDGMGQFGNINGTASCNVGAPDWTKSATGDGTTTFAVGYRTYPNPVGGGNNGDYIYQVQSCSGTCTTGPSKPHWPQAYDTYSPPTVTDNTITWVNTGLVANCRADAVVVKLTR